MTFEESTTLTTVFITQFIGCKLMDKRTGKFITKDIYRLGGQDKHRLVKEMQELGFDLKEITDVVTRKSNIDIRDYFNAGTEVEYDRR